MIGDAVEQVSAAADRLATGTLADLTRAMRALSVGDLRGSVAVLFLDLDQFKLINDSRGHRAGDELLQAVATRLSSVMRPGDTVARFGGDEFCVVCDDVDDAMEAIGIARRIIDRLGRPYTLAGGEHFATVSIGIALADGPLRPADDLVREADAAMYRAKPHGRGRYELFDEVMRGDATRRLRLDHDLRRALDRTDELVAYYQPIVALPGGEIVGMEALMRWRHPSAASSGQASSSRSPRTAARSSTSAIACCTRPAIRRPHGARG